MRVSSEITGGSPIGIASEQLNGIQPDLGGSVGGIHTRRYLIPLFKMVL